MWKTIQIHDTNCEAVTTWSWLIKFPKKSEFNGYYTYISKKLIREGYHSASFGVSFTDDFKFKIFRRSKKGKYDEIEITAEEFESAFANNNIVKKKQKEGVIILDDKIIKHHVPKLIEVNQIEPEKELMK